MREVLANCAGPRAGGTRQERTQGEEGRGNLVICSLGLYIFSIPSNEMSPVLFPPPIVLVLLGKKVVRLSPSADGKIAF